MFDVRGSKSDLPTSSLGHQCPLTTVTLATLAMATRFEIVLHGDDPVRLRAAGEEAIEEIRRLDRQLSRFDPESDVSWINARASSEPVKVDPRLLRLIQRAAEITEGTDGAFDITVCPLMRAWDLTGEGRVPTPSELDQARAVVGMHHVRLDQESFTVGFDMPGVEIDLGAIGKGYAIECAVEILRENGVTSALIHGGTSTIYGLATPPDEDGWSVALAGSQIRGDGSGIAYPGPTKREERVVLHDSALSVSAPHGRFFERAGRRYGHVIDPRTSEPAEGALLAAVTGPSPTETDALSTALLVLGEPWLPEIERRFAGCRGYVEPAERTK